jgi:hypothetical protein
VVELEHLEPVDLVGPTKLGARPLGLREIVVSVGRLGIILLAGTIEDVKRVLPDRLQHPEARFVPQRRDLTQQALARQRVEPVEEIATRISGGGRDDGGRVQGESSAANGESPKECLLFRFQQRVVPIDRIAKRLLACGEVARTACKQAQPAAQPVEEDGWGQELDAHGRQLDGEGQAVEPMADFGDVASVRVGECEVGLDRACTLHEQPDGGVRRKLCDVGEVVELG